MKNLENFRKEKRAIELIIRGELEKIFNGIYEDYGTTPINLTVDVQEVRQMGERYSRGMVSEVSVDFDLEGSP